MAHFFCLFFAAILCVGSNCPGSLNAEIQYQGVSVSLLASQGFVHVGETKLQEMLQRGFSGGYCKQNICGFDAGAAAAFLLTPREEFKDPATGFSLLSKLLEKYPIIRLRDVANRDMGVFPNSLADFWSAQLLQHKLVPLGFNDVRMVDKKMKDEIQAGRPLLVLVRVAPSGLPVFMPDPHFGVRTFWNSHYVVIVGYREGSNPAWLVRDNGGLGLKGYSRLPYDDNLVSIPDADLKRVLHFGVAEDFKTYLSEPRLPVVLADAGDDENQTKFRRDLDALQTYNILVFTNK